MWNADPDVQAVPVGLQAGTTGVVPLVVDE